MRVYAIILCIIFVGAKLFVRWWWFRPTHARPGFIRHTEALRLLDLAAVLAMIGAVFFLLNSDELWRALAVGLGLLIYDLLLRTLFLHLEVRRILASSPKWTYRDARRRVRRRVRGETSL